MTEIKHIEVVRYDPKWLEIFEEQAIIIRKSLGDNCLAVHHVGSTAIEVTNKKALHFVIK